MDIAKNGTRELETKRLLLRRFTVDDADMMFKNWASDPDVTKYLSWNTHENIEFTKNLLNDWVEDYKSVENYNWAIVLKEDKVVIGSIGTVPYSILPHCAEIGYCIGKKWWNKGIMSEALNEIIGYLFKEGYFRLQARHIVLNKNSGKVMQKCKMEYEGIMRAGIYRRGEYVDTAVYSILKSD